MDSQHTYQAKYNNSRALIIGINEYKNISPLGYAVNDATEIAQLLENRFGFPKKNISLLLDSQATGEAIRNTFMKYIEDGVTHPDDRIIVFFAGHGHTLSGVRGEVGFLVPYDGDADNPSTFVRWDEFTRNADLIQAKHIFFIMDACYGGLAFVRKPAFGNMRFLGDMLQRYSRQVLTAGKANETVADGNGVRPGHSIFTAHLLNALEGAAATEDGILTANGVMAYVYDRVARDQFSHQTPHYGFVDGDGDFIFDMSVLEKIRAEDKENKVSEKEPVKDILVNTSPEITIAPNETVSISDEMKVLLADPVKRIKLDDYVSLHVRRLLDRTDLRHFPVQALAVNKDTVLQRIKEYEEIVRDLQQIVILIAKWGNKEQLQLLERAFVRIAESDKGSAGTIVWIDLGWYPLMILMYTAGITALVTKKYDVLPIVLQTLVRLENKDKDEPLIYPVVGAMNNLFDTFKVLPGYENKYVPRSEYLFKYLQPILEDELLLGRSYETLFDKFEVLFALVYADVTNHDWGPPGRFAWKQTRHYGESPFDNLVDEATKEAETWGPIVSGLFQGSTDRFGKDVNMLKELIPRFNFH